MNTVKPFDPMGVASVELGSSKLNTLVNENNANQIIPGGKGIRITRTSSGVTVSAIRPKPPKTANCPFGQLASSSSIKGGLILCGDKNFNVPNYEIDLSSDGERVVYITIPCEVNMDDDSELILPGIKTSSAVSITGADWTVGASYPANTNPTVASAGIGTFIFPIGSITITDGAQSNFVPTGCGTCTVTQCAGTLGHTRG